MVKKLLSSSFLLLLFISSFGQTSWIGVTNNKWKTSSNWTAGVPSQSKDVIIGDDNFTGSYQPELNGNAKCKSLTIGNGTKASTLSIKKNITVYGDLVIGTNGTIDAPSKKTVTLRGNFINNGTYTASHNDARVTFSGSDQTITGITTFNHLCINSGCDLTLSSDIVVEKLFEVKGTIDPTENYTISGNANVDLESNGTLMVFASTFTENYSLSGTYSIDRSSTVNYASSTLSQTVSDAFSYGKLRISGGSLKELAANLPDIQSGNGSGHVYIDAGTFDLKGFTANRSSGGGGNFVMSAGTALKIGGTNGFPQNFNNQTISSTSTVEYYGNNQTIGDLNYGNLVITGTSGSVIKTMPTSSMVVNGDFSATIGTASDISMTAGDDIEFKKGFVIGPNVTFNGGSHELTYRENWTNNGTLQGATSTCVFRGVSSTLSGSGTTQFHDVDFRANGITSAINAISISGDLKSTNGGNFHHQSPGTLTMTGSGKVISGNGIRLNNLVIPGSVTTSADISILGNATVNGSFTATNGTISFNGNSKSITGTGAITFHRLNINDVTTASIGFTIKNNFYIDPSCSFNATVGNIIFDGITTLSGEASVFDIIINSGKTLKLGTDSKLTINNTFTNNGSFNATSNKPNLVVYNKTGNQNIVAEDYYHLTLSNGGTKSMIGNTTIEGNLTIDSGVNLDGASYAITVYNDWINNGTFIPSTSDVLFRSGNISNIYGTNTFNDLTFNKSSTSSFSYLKGDATASNIIMTKGILDTESNTITTTGGRTGNGFIYGTIEHNHTFVDGTAYYFEGPQNSITFSSPSIDLTSVSVTCQPEEVTDFDPNLECIHREYEIVIPTGTYTNATLRLHYLDNELNAFEEPFLAFYKHNSGVTWDSIGFTSRNTNQDWVEHTGLTNIVGRYTLSGTRRIIEWDGSVSSDWNDQNNWTTVSGSDMSNRVPDSDDAVRIGTSTFTNQPTINSPQEIAALKLGSAQAVTLTMSDDFTVLGSINGIWSTNRTHTINVNEHTLDIGRNLDLSDGTVDHDMTVNISTGHLIIGNDIDQEANSSIVFTDAGNITVSGNYNYVSGTFNSGTGTVTYTGPSTQTAAPITYHNISFTKTNERAKFDLPALVNGNLTMSTGGSVLVSDTLTVMGDVTIGASTTMIENNAQLYIHGDWLNNGTFTAGNGSVCFVGNSNQTSNESTFNNIYVNKPGGTLNLTGNVAVNSDFSILSGSMDLDVNTLNRTSDGGTFTMSSGTNLSVSGADNFPDNFVTHTLDPLSVVNYNGTGIQNVRADISYGILNFSNGGVNAKEIDGDITVNTTLTINSGATLAPDSVNITLNGDLINSGTITPGESTLVLDGTSKTLTGPMTLNDINVNGTYTVTSGTTTMQGDLFVENSGSLNFGNNDAILDGDLTNKGSLISNGTATFTGTRVQTLQLLNAITSSSTGVVNFNGSVSPVINSTSSPAFATVNINNTAGITPSVPWFVYFNCNIAAGATFNGGPLTHTFYGNFTNNGTVTSSGTMLFNPGAPFSASGTVTLDGISYASTGTTEFGGTAPLTIVDNNPVFNNVVISNSFISGVTAPSSWDIDNELRILEGSIFNAGTGTNHTIAKTIVNNGTLNGDTSTITFDGAGSEIDGTGTTTFNDLRVATGADLTLNKSISINEDLTVDGTFYSDGRRVSFTGTTSSIIDGLSGSLNLNELEMYKFDASTTLNIPVTITDELILTRGNLITDATNLLTITDDAIATSGKNKSFVDGPITKVGDDAFVFPVGDNTKWARLGISAPLLTTDAFTVEYNETFYTDTNTMASVPLPVLNNVSKVEYWTCDRTNGVSGVTVELFWEDNAHSGIDDYSTDLNVARWNGSGWENAGQSAINSGPSGSITSNTISSFSPFTFGSRSSSLNPLPIELLSFEANPVQDIVLLEWSTASELNNDYFDIEKSKRGEFWENVTTVSGAGNSNTILQYTARDYDPFEGLSYYRLKQTDFDGKFTYSEVKAVEFSDPSDADVWVYPNPTKGQLTLSGNLNEIEGFKIYNPVGQDVTSHVQVINTFSGGYLIDLQQLSQGIYTIVTKTQALKVYIE